VKLIAFYIVFVVTGEAIAYHRPSSRAMVGRHEFACVPCMFFLLFFGPPGGSRSASPDFSGSLNTLLFRNRHDG
jgi:hypothetical protein